MVPYVLKHIRYIEKCHTIEQELVVILMNHPEFGRYGISLRENALDAIICVNVELYDVSVFQDKIVYVGDDVRIDHLLKKIHHLHV